MGLPPSVVKFKKGNMEFVSEVDRAQYTITELARAALRDTGRYLKREIQANVPVFRGVLRQNVGFWVPKAEKGQLPELQVGIYKPSVSRKKKLRPAYHAHLVQFGARGGIMPANPFLDTTTYANIETIRTLQAKYLSAIDDTGTAQGLIDEDEYDGEEP